MKPKVCHFVGGQGMGWTGGIKATLKSLEMSWLSEKFEFITAPLSAASSVISKHHPDVTIVHAASSWQGLLPLWKLRRSGKLIINEHHYSAGFEAFNVPSLTRFHRMLKLAYGMCDRLVTVSQGQQNWILKNQLASADKISVIPFSRLIYPFFNIPPKPRLSNQPFILGAYGRFSYQKGFDILIDAVKHIPGSRIQLQIGGGGQDEDKLKQLAANCPHIEFVGRIDDVPAFLSQCDAVVIPSRWEPWGNVCLEARAAGKPIIASAVDGLSEQIQDFGLLIPPENSVALAKAIQELVDLPALELEHKGQQGKASAINSWQTYLSNWEVLLEELT
ncbi:glycosyltransferase family 4 protein [Anabaena cylindrica FACHB-243]|uniref:Glycosyl transferase group 1 n=1 Tax=Anabaena cylindrica (strain ATCC 27899 / PCC 7122) TaxID=272123 RepID=K9ZJA7_ANACC|nr:MULTISPECIES: glycosyltransferase family 4 protein [Anabaena]AFZ58637.1 glycosyl transferase group 1 [Anabaena cylindrica PCC 7122]MBD2419982.1 glycosyltransferase family 4 protein [Anabaena cylindrica FACHB-243]MBY5282890.1 glycosyltransferase family 4 protein [Anabaena sp. CCAP 1446/1C]MBY5310400.1 glycosyltransferase family 4 protein [Anabaena sp. CCAP 1446/1C]MCM2407124.1 glycosyltransferase family 4 protein [Anabaena sp. CCAP 1446/1C]